LAIIAGIDEAGYGPTLGPLVVTATVFRIPDDKVNESMWKLLRESCSHVTKKRTQKLIIADSKKLYSKSSGIAPLERTALVMLSAIGKLPTTFPEYLNAVSPDTISELGAYPWYADASFSIPISEGVGDIATRANAIKRDCKQQNIELLGVFSAPLLEGAFNQIVSRTHNKASALLGLVLRLISKIMRKGRSERVKICVDRLGGRQRYRETLSTSWPAHALSIVEESPNRSAYHLSLASEKVDIEFTTKGEDHHLPIALASVYSKYLRELCMHAFNAFWSVQLPGLKPTAGYYTDAHRWLADTDAVINQIGIDRDMLIRQR